MTRWKRRQSNMYDPHAKEPYSLSRTRIERFLECPRCFYLDRKLGLDRPGMPGWPLNSAVDQLLKNEFDLLRKKGQRHELMERYNIDAVPFEHPDLPLWRDDANRFTGAKVLHKKTSLYVDGIIDDLWIDLDKRLLIVDYKATSTVKEISLEDEYKQGYKKQVEIYQWIFRQKNFKVSNTAYFIFANAGKNKPKFDGILEFETEILIHTGDDSWVEPVLYSIKDTLDSGKIPEPGEACEFCPYRTAVGNVEKK